MAVHQAKIGEFGLGDPPLGRQNTEGIKKTIALHTYIVRPTAIKFGTVRGVANGHLFPECGEPGSRATMRPHASVLQ